MLTFFPIESSRCEIIPLISCLGILGTDHRGAVVPMKTLIDFPRTDLVLVTIYPLFTWFKGLHISNIPKTSTPRGEMSSLAFHRQNSSFFRDVKLEMMAISSLQSLLLANLPAP